MTAEQRQPPPDVHSTAVATATRETEPDERYLRVTAPAGLLALIPHLLGFRPADSLVIIGTRPPSAVVHVTLRYDLPDPADPKAAAWIAQHAARILATEGTDKAVAVGYGPDWLVTPVVGELQNSKAPRLPLTEILRAADGRYWSYLCTEPGCCPAEGTPFDPGEPVAAALAAEGPVLSSRDELAASVARIEGGRATMRRATDRAEQRAAELRARPAPTGQGTSAHSEIVLVSLDAVAQAIDRYRRGGQLSAGNDAAWLTLVLRDSQVRDDAWSRMLPEHCEAHLRLWQDLTRLARPGYVAAPASLLALVAWQSGNGALANVALDRALADDPTYRIAELLRQVIGSGAPTRARPPMTPEEVAAHYDGSIAHSSRRRDRASRRRAPRSGYPPRR
jgi:hypothetical protein